MDKKRPEILSEPSASYDRPYTYADYLTWEFEEMVELIKGRIFKMSPAPGSTHQKVCGNFHLSIGQYLKNRKCQVFIAPYDIILPIKDKKRESATTVVQPDLCIICDESMIEERGCFGVPDWIIEVISPTTSKKDINLKYDVYEEAGVKEYWVVYPLEQLVQIFVLENRTYARKGSFDFDDTLIPETLPELEIPLSEIFEKKKLY